MSLYLNEEHSFLHSCRGWSYIQNLDCVYPLVTLHSLNNNKYLLLSMLISRYHSNTWILISRCLVVSVFSLLFTYFLYIGAFRLIHPVSITWWLRIGTVWPIISIGRIPNPFVPLSAWSVAFWRIILRILQVTFMNFVNRTIIFWEKQLKQFVQ